MKNTDEEIEKHIRDGGFYIYIYKSLEGVPIYVGKGRFYRWKAHFRYKKSSNKRLFNYLAKCENTVGYFYKPDILIAKSEDDAFEMEEMIISMIGRDDINTGSLFNFTDGGEGPSGFITPPELSKKRSEYMKIRSNTPENKMKISKFHKEYQNRPDVKEANRIKSTGRIHTEESKKKISEANSGLKRSEEFCERNGLLKAGKPQNTAQCQFCGAEVSKSNLKRHEEKCESNPNAKPRSRKNSQSYSLSRVTLRSKSACSPESDQTSKPEELPPQS